MPAGDMKTPHEYCTVIEYYLKLLYCLSLEYQPNDKRHYSIGLIQMCF